MKKKILFVYPHEATFIKIEKEILSKEFEVTDNTYKWHNKLLLPIMLIRQFFTLLFTIKNTDVVLASFGGYSSLIPAVISKFYGKPFFVVVHGTDCVSFPEMNYGVLRKRSIKFFCKYTYRYATKVLPVSESLIGSINYYFQEGLKLEHGLKYQFPSEDLKYKVIHNGIEIEKWFNEKGQEKNEELFVAVFSESQFYLKGGDLIIQLALEFPNYTFWIVGFSKPIFLGNVSDNVQFLGRKTPVELREIYSQAGYYFQLSNFEGFGCALCEAMLCECIPIGSSVNMIPEIVEDSGYTLKHRDLDDLIQLINRLEYNLSLGKKAREKVLNQYPVSKRSKKLIEVLNNFIQD